MSEELKALIQRYTEEIFHKGNLNAIEEFIAPNYIRHTSHFREGGHDVHGPEGLRQSVSAFRATFPDAHFTLEDVLVDGDKIVVRLTCHATQKGEFMGIAPTGKSVTFTGISIYRIANGKIVERWGVEDGVSLLQQLGAIPAR
jgi:predicted ester cyclase